MKIQVCVVPEEPVVVSEELCFIIKYITQFIFLNNKLIKLSILFAHVLSYLVLKSMDVTLTLCCVFEKLPVVSEEHIVVSEEQKHRIK